MQYHATSCTERACRKRSCTILVALAEIAADNASKLILINTPGRSDIKTCDLEETFTFLIIQPLPEGINFEAFAAAISAKAMTTVLCLVWVRL